MSLKSKIFAAIGAVGFAALLWVGQVVWDYYDPNSIPHLAMQTQLRLFGAAMYEYHSRTGRWPDKLDDLAQTSLPQKSYIWRQSATTLVFLWPQNLHAEPKDNPNVLLLYTDKGWFNNLGRMWVCWGDLRTEHMRTEVLRAALRK